MTSKKFTAGVKSGKIKYYNLDLDAIGSRMLMRDAEHFWDMDVPYNRRAAEKRKQTYFDKLKKWGEEVVASYGR